MKDCSNRSYSRNTANFDLPGQCLPLSKEHPFNVAAVDEQFAKSAFFLQCPARGRLFGWIKLTKSCESRFAPKMHLVCEEMSSQRALDICGGGRATLGNLWSSVQFT